jgi:Fe-Mn family superoxide dismutase
MIYELPQLPYSYDSFESYIDADTMLLHHTKHHAAYVNKLNDLLLEAKYSNPSPIEEFTVRIKYANLPENLREVTKFNAGGHYNHSLFWQIIIPEKVNVPKDLLNAICKSFGSFEEFKTTFEKSALSHLGSGWMWLCVDQEKKAEESHLFVCSTPNHDSPNMIGYSPRVGDPILILDLWEHAFYLKYNNRKVDYVKNFWSIINWNNVAERYRSSIAKVHI